MKKKIFAGILALAAVLALVCIIFAQGGSGAYVPAADEIALRIQFDTKEDVGLLVYGLPRGGPRLQRGHLQRGRLATSERFGKHGGVEQGGAGKHR